MKASYSVVFCSGSLKRLILCIVCRDVSWLLFKTPSWNVMSISSFSWHLFLATWRHGTTVSYPCIMNWPTPYKVWLGWRKCMPSPLMIEVFLRGLGSNSNLLSMDIQKLQNSQICSLQPLLRGHCIWYFPLLPASHSSCQPQSLPKKSLCILVSTSSIIWKPIKWHYRFCLCVCGLGLKLRKYYNLL